MPKLVPELYCTNIKKSLEFYVDLLGFRIVYERPEEGFAYLERQGAELMLDEITKTRTWIKSNLEYPYGRGINFQIETLDVENLYQKIQNQNAEIFLNLEKKYYRCDDKMMGNWQFIVIDPDGYLLRFFEDLGEKK